MEHTFWYISLLSLLDDEMEFVIFVGFYRIKTQDNNFFCLDTELNSLKNRWI